MFPSPLRPALLDEREAGPEERKERFITRIVLLNPLSVTRSDVGAIVSVQEFGFDLPGEVLGVQAPIVHLVEDVLVKKAAPRAKTTMPLRLPASLLSSCFGLRAVPSQPRTIQFSSQSWRPLWKAVRFSTTFGMADGGGW